ncbi:MAG: ABC transporter substrate-binding protein [bacterium]|nr:MAG: ABC transporter substrate-binding protein [bacterium]
MKTLIKIAWRNLWRNRRRTILTASAVVLALFLALIMRSMQFGSYEQWIQAGVNQVGDLQVHDTGYWANQSIDRAFFYRKSIGKTLAGIKGIKRVLPGLKTFSLASYGKQTKGVLISGIDAVLQNQQNNLSGKIVRGKYLTGNNNDVLLGDKLAEFLKIRVGDTLVLLGQGYRGITAYGIYKVAGIFHMPSIQMNNQLVFMNLKAAQDFVYPYQSGLLTSLSVFLKDPAELETARNKIQHKLGPDYEVIPWKTMLSDILQTIKVDNISGQLMLLILYIIAAFGIFSTILMMTMEKRKQYAIMVSIGMERRKLVWVSIFETFIISVIGIIIGLLLASPVIYYLHFNPIPITGDVAKMYLEFNIEPILPFSIKAHVFMSQTIIVLVLSLLSSLYPIIYLSKFNILNAFRH